jgi:hypothetical protein
MPDLGRFAQLAERAGVPPVPPAHFRGGTETASIEIKQSQYLALSVPPVPPPNDHSGDEDYWRDEFEERAAILEFDAGYTRAEAETLARAFVKEARAQQ